MYHNDLEVYRNCLQKSLQFRIFDLTYNKLKKIPDNFCHYATETYLGHNKITEISRTFPTSSIKNGFRMELNTLYL